MPALRDHLSATGRYTFLPGVEARAITGTRVRDDRGVQHDGDLVVVCTGAAHGGLVRELAGDLPVRRVRLQMMQTAPLGEQLAPRSPTATVCGTTPGTPAQHSTA